MKSEFCKIYDKNISKFSKKMKISMIYKVSALKC